MIEQFEHGGNVYNSSGQLSDWLDMSANINPIGLSEAVKSAIISNIDGLIHYPDPAVRELKSAISTRYKVNYNNIITLNGAVEFFYLFLNAIRPKRVLIIVPSFSEYERAAMAAGCDIEYFFTYVEDNFNINFERLKKIIKDENISCIVLANPNNPTGNTIALDEIVGLLNIIEFVLIDESFVDFIGDEFSVRNLLNQYKNLIVVQSLTKFFAIPGLRLGFAVANEAMIQCLERRKDVWNVNHLAQKAGVAALVDENYISKSRKWISEEKLHVVERLKKISKIKFFKPTVNFVLIKFQSEKIALKIIENLKSHRILVRSCANFRGLDCSYIRIAIRYRKDNDRVIDLIENMLEVD